MSLRVCCIFTKSGSNILLDSEFNGKLGDFGLARLYENKENSQTTSVVGTLGYIVPELIHKGKASPATNVFSFGIFLLGFTCGRILETIN